MSNHADIKQRLSAGSSRINEVREQIEHVNERIQKAKIEIERIKIKIEKVTFSENDLQAEEEVRARLDENVQRLELILKKQYRKSTKRR